jgi:hypothetical protein
MEDSCNERPPLSTDGKLASFDSELTLLERDDCRVPLFFLCLTCCTKKYYGHTSNVASAAELAKGETFKGDKRLKAVDWLME